MPICVCFSVTGMIINQHCHYLTYEVSGALKTQTQAICPTADVYNGREAWETSVESACWVNMST